MPGTIDEIPITPINTVNSTVVKTGGAAAQAASPAV